MQLRNLETVKWELTFKPWIKQSLIASNDWEWAETGSSLVFNFVSAWGQQGCNHLEALFIWLNDVCLLT